MYGLPFGCLSLVLLLGLIFLIPLFLANAVMTALAKLGLSPFMSIVVAASIFIGGLVNIPVKRIERVGPHDYFPFGISQFGRFWPGRIAHRPYTVIAVNVGGCLIPCLLVLYELSQISAIGARMLALTALAAGVNILICYRLARPVRNVGIALPALIPALAAAASALVLAPDYAPPVAFTAGVLGPVVGADLLHLKDVTEVDTGIASIGGAGTFDGIVLSGLIATLLA